MKQAGTKGCDIEGTVLETVLSEILKPAFPVILRSCSEHTLSGKLGKSGCAQLVKSPNPHPRRWQDLAESAVGAHAAIQACDPQKVRTDKPRTCGKACRQSVKDRAYHRTSNLQGLNAVSKTNQPKSIAKPPLVRAAGMQLLHEAGAEKAGQPFHCRGRTTLP